MSVYKPKGSPFYHYDFQWRNRRYCGSTGSASRRPAQCVERAERERVRRTVIAEAAASSSLRLADVAARYWQEVGRHHAGASNTWRDLARLVKYFGEDKLLTDIADDDVAKLVTWRRGHMRPNATPAEVTMAEAGVVRQAEETATLILISNTTLIRFSHTGAR